MVEAASRGHQWPITPARRAKILERMKELKMRKADLARAVGTSTAQITLFFNQTKSSWMLPRIHKALKWPPPEMADIKQDEIDELKAEFDENWSLLTDEERDIMVRLVRVAAKRRSST